MAPGFLAFALFTPFLLSIVSAHDHEIKYMAVLRGDPGVEGNVTLCNQNGAVKIHVSIIGLKPGQHGFHIHEKGDISGGCGSTGGHYNPFGKKHGGPNDTERHVGDLGNVRAGDDGKVDYVLVDPQVKLEGPYNVLGRAFVVHADEDDLGKGGHSDSLTTGHAGARVGCGVIGIM